jgi:acylphosphatase
MMACAKFIVSGRVQGVFFRASTRAEAERLRLSGHARNLADGSVEVVACGDAAALHELDAWLQHGPPAARVQSVVRSELAGGNSAGSGFRAL